MWNNHLYLAGTIYRSQHIGAPVPNTGLDSSGTPLQFNIRGLAPYWRVAWQQTTKNNYLEVGTYGMHVKSSPGAITGLEDSYTDWAVDFQYDRTIPRFGGDIFSFRGTYIRENSSLLASANNGAAELVQHHLNTVQANAEYHFGDRYSATVGWFNVTGTPDPLLYAQRLRVWQRQRRSEEHWLYRERLVVAGPEHPAFFSIHGIFALQRRQAQTMSIGVGTQCRCK